MKLQIRIYKSRFYAIFLAILPIIWMYNVPGINLGVSTILLYVCGFYAFIVCLFRYRQIKFNLLFPLFLYVIYTIFIDQGTSSILFGIFFLLHLFAISTGAVEVDMLRKAIEIISIIASILLGVQLLVYYTFGQHICLVSPYYLTEAAEGYKTLLQTGYSNTDSMYRPSAFFLEPAHFSQYCIIGLGSLLYRKKVNYLEAVVISVGIFFTTSGLGLILVFAMWGWWYISNSEKLNVSLLVRRLIVIVLLVLIGIFILLQIPYFNSALQRTFGRSLTGYNAIIGRTYWWDRYFSGFSLSGFLTGFGINALPEGTYFTGFMRELYAYGVIGTALFLFFLLWLVFHTKKLARTLSIMYTALLFVANLTASFFLLFFIGTIISIGLEQDSVNSIIPSSDRLHERGKDNIKAN